MKHFKDLNTAHVTTKKIEKISGIVNAMMEIDKITEVYMNSKKFPSPNHLIQAEMKDVDKALKFWKHMLEAAKKFDKKP